MQRSAETGGHRRAAFYAPRLTAPERLRVELEALRDQGRPFLVAWAPAVAIALDGLTLRESRFWRDTFTRQRRVWADCYSGEGSCNPLAQHRESSVPRVGRLVA